MAGSTEARERTYNATTTAETTDSSRNPGSPGDSWDSETQHSGNERYNELGYKARTAEDDGVSLKRWLQYLNANYPRVSWAVAGFISGATAVMSPQVVGVAILAAVMYKIW